MHKRPKILLLTLHSPNGERYGASTRAQLSYQLLQEIADVELAIISYSSISQAEQEQLHRDHKILLIDSLTRAPLRGLRQRLEHEFNPKTMRITGHQIAAKTKQTLLAALPNYDFCWMHTTTIANAMGEWSWPNTVLDIDDIPSLNFRSKLTSGTFLTKLKATRAYILAKRREVHLAARFTTLVSCSEEDRRYLGGGRNIFVLPNSVSSAPQDNFINRSTKRIGFIGNFAHEPNRQGLQWFIDQIWPSIKRSNPDAQLRVIGNHHNLIESNDKRIFFLGYLDQIKAELESWNHTVVPIQTGSGTRVKIAEALAAKIPIVSTTIGARGYISKTSAHILLADTPAAFAQHCDNLLNNIELNQNIQREGAVYFDRELSKTALQQNISTIVAQF